MTYPNKELPEKDFIQDSLRKNPFPAWIWLIVLLCLIAILWGVSSWYYRFISYEVSKSPFLQVTNRQFSLFLWQFPEYMRVNAKSKGSYLPGFQYENKISLVLSEADKVVVAPPEILFLYHTWSRLIRDEFFSRSISASEFKEFLQYTEEWQPKNWPEAPTSYTATVEALLKKENIPDLNAFNESELPVEVRQAFQGWKNYFKEGDAINHLKPSLNEVRQFVQAAPHYARNFWRNILIDSYPKYLLNVDVADSKENQPLAEDEMAPFFRVAIYNFLHSNLEKSMVK